MKGLTSLLLVHQLVKLLSAGRQRLEAELEVFLSLDHPHIARLLRATRLWNFVDLEFGRGIFMKINSSYFF